MTQISERWKVTGRAAMLAIALVLIGCAPHGSTQTARTQTTKEPKSESVAEADRLDEEIEALFNAGKLEAAIPLAERSLALRERALGFHHVDVATSLHNLGKIYREQAAYARAEPLMLRALGIREKALGMVHPDVAHSLNGLANLYEDQAEYARAEPLHVRALEIREKTLGAMHPDVAGSLNNLAYLYAEQGLYARAEPLYVRALEIREKALGAMHPDVAEGLNGLALLYQKQGMYARAEPLFVRALDITEKALGAMHPIVGLALNNLGALYSDQGAYAKVEPLYVRALEITEKARGAMHPIVAGMLNNLAVIHQEQGAYAKAEPLYVRALEITEKVLGAMHPDVAISLGNLANVYLVQGAYAKAESLFRRALEIREKALGAMHPDVANSLSSLALLHYERGAYAHAEALWDRALEIQEKALGTMHPEVARILGNLALLYSAQGARARAEQLYVRALEISEQARGVMHPDVATMLHNLAAIYSKQREYGRAEPLCLRALEIREKALGAMHPSVGVILNTLATIYLDRGLYERAEPLYLRALDIQEKALGAMHPTVATSLNNLGMSLLSQGKYKDAEPLLVRALEIKEQALGPLHSEVARGLNNLAGVYEGQQQYARAVPLLVRGAEIQESNLRAELARLSESRKRDLVLLLRAETERVVSLHAHAMPTSARMLELALTVVLRRKSRVLDSLADTQSIMRAHGTPKLRDKLNEVTELSAELSQRLRSPVVPQTAEGQKAEISNLRGRIDKLEAELNTASVAFRAQSESVAIAKVQAELPHGAALVEFVRYRRFDERPAQVQQRLREARYLAYILTSRGPPQWVALGEAARIEAGVDAVLAAMRKGAGTEPARAALRNLDALVWAPIRGRLAGVSHVILSPDDKLNLVPFEALIDPQGRYALEQYLVSYVTSGRDLLRLAARQPSRSVAAIVADPDYGSAGKPYVRVDGTLAETYGRLAGTLAEADGIRRYFADARTLAQGQATKAALTAIAGPSVLHIATHGFYSRAGVSTQAPLRPAPRERGMSVERTTLPPPPKEDPVEALDRAGLALAGANVGPEGIVSARELAGLDLWGTELVVLSACSTGVGAMPSGEGVYGMRRALVLAGARSQVVSLWNVSDSAAPELMRAFYEELARGTGRAEALRRAKLRMARQPRFAHPYYWAAFIAAGDWAPLEPGIMKPAASEPATSP